MNAERKSERRRLLVAMEAIALGNTEEEIAEVYHAICDDIVEQYWVLHSEAPAHGLSLNKHVWIVTSFSFGLYRSLLLLKELTPGFEEAIAACIARIVEGFKIDDLAEKANKLACDLLAVARNNPDVDWMLRISLAFREGWNTAPSLIKGLDVGTPDEWERRAIGQDVADEAERAVEEKLKDGTYEIKTDP